MKTYTGLAQIVGLNEYMCKPLCEAVWNDMRKIIFRHALCLIFLLLFTGSDVSGQTSPSSGVDVRIITDEADALLQVLAKRENSLEITEEDWRKIFSSEGYVRLKKRELSLKRPFEDADFKDFVLSADLLRRRQSLAETLAGWKDADVDKVARRPLAYLPKGALIRAKIYPVIKPRDNSFIFDIPDDPSIFMYLDPDKSRESFESDLAHELHHIGFGTACPNENAKAAVKKLSPRLQSVLRWIGAFGEGFAMLAAAGGADVHPHRFSPPEDRARWDKDVANCNHDLLTVERFFLDLAEGKLSEAEEREKAFSFYGVQGPWYTVGWRMAVVIEETLGRDKLIEVMCDQRKLLPAYNKAAKRYGRRHGQRLALWSAEIVGKLKGGL